MLELILNPHARPKKTTDHRPLCAVRDADVAGARRTDDRLPRHGHRRPQGARGLLRHADARQRRHRQHAALWLRRRSGSVHAQPDLRRSSAGQWLRRLLRSNAVRRDSLSGRLHGAVAGDGRLRHCGRHGRVSGV